MVFSLNIRFHTESWSKWDLSPRPHDYCAHGLTIVYCAMVYCAHGLIAILYIYIYIYIYI